MKELTVIAVVGLIGWMAWSAFFATNYSKPWWKGNEVQNVCSTTGSENCYKLIVSSDGENITGISMPNGGYLTAHNSECVKASSVKDAHLCRMWDSDNIKWDITKI